MWTWLNASACSKTNTQMGHYSKRAFSLLTSLVKVGWFILLLLTGILMILVLGMVLLGNLFLVRPISNAIRKL